MKRLPLLFFLTGNALAQSPYLGGLGDGHAASDVVNQPLNATIPVTELFLGGNADGHDGKTLSAWPLNQSPVTSDPTPFSGAVGDGFASTALSNRQLGPLPDAASNVTATAGAAGGDGFGAGTLANRQLGSALDPSWDVVFLAGGSGGDGFASASGVNLNLTPPPPPSGPYFAGDGGGDGFSSTTLHNRMLGDPADPVFTIVALSGAGGGDGFSSAQMENRMLGPDADVGFTTIALSGAGAGDGFSSSLLSAFPLTTPVFPFFQYTGGPAGGDGFASSSIFNYFMGNISEPFSTYLGGPGDGFDEARISNFQMEFHIGSPLNFATLQNLLFTATEITAGLADGSADADGDGVPNLIEFVLGTDLRNGRNSIIIPPTLASPSSFGLPPDGNTYLTLDIPRSPNALGVTLGAEFSSTLGTTNWDSGSWIPLLNYPNRLVIRDNLPSGSTPSRFGRVTARLNP